MRTNHRIGALFAGLLILLCTGGPAVYALTPLPTVGEMIDLNGERRPISPLPTVGAVIDLNGERRPISPYIYGINGIEPGMTQKSARSGGNRMTGYNWHNNYSSAGSDWQHFNDDYLLGGIADEDKNTPGIVLTDFARKAAAAGAYSIVTLPMAGYVANDNDKSVPPEETAPSKRWAKVEDRKPGGDFTLQPDRMADTVYSDELVNFLIQTLGNSSSVTGVKGYSLDNEPALWPETHPRIHPDKVTVDELIERTVSLASAVKNLDPGAEVFGPALYGFGAFMTLQSAADWENNYKNQYEWFIDCYLDKMREAETAAGRRLLDVLDLHYYSEAQNANNQRICFANPTDDESAAALMQSTRTLWDGSYTEKSWVAQWFSQFLPLLPKITASIEQYYPGTKLAFTEYGFGSMHHISGGVAVADALGIFAENGVYLATLWPSGGMDYAVSAVNMYTNADGKGLAFGDALLPVSLMEGYENSAEWGGVYASEDADGKLHLILTGRDPYKQTQFDLQIDGKHRVERRMVLDGESSVIREETSVDGTVWDGLLSVVVPAMSVSHLVLVPAGEPEPLPSPATVQSPAPPEETPSPAGERTLMSWLPLAGIVLLIVGGGAAVLAFRNRERS